MAQQLLPLEVAYQSGQDVYAVVRGVVAGTRQVWNPTLNSGDGDWEAFNGANWAQYAIALAEQGTSGYYAADYPANITGVLTSETFYANPTPTLGDAAISSQGRAQGQNLGAVAGDADVPAALQQALISEQRGAAAGVPTASVIPTDLTNAQANAYQGRAVIFTSGAAFQCVGRIISYTVSGGVLTLAAPLAVAPAATDTFIVV